MKHFDDYSNFNEAKEDRVKKRISRKEKRASRKEKKADKIEGTKGLKAEKLREKARKKRIRINNITNKFNNKNLSIKYKIKALNNLIVNFRTSRRNLRKQGDKVEAKNMDNIIKILKQLRSRLELKDFDKEEFDLKINKIAKYAALIETEKNEGSIMKQINAALVEAEDKGIITPKEKEEAIQKGEEKVTGKADKEKEKEIETEREETPIDTSMKFGEFKTKFKGLETVIKPISAPLLSRAFEKQKLGVVQFLQLFLNQRNFYSIKEAVELIKDETNVDGFFGEKTENALKAYQTKKGIATTGKTDKETWKAIYKDIGLATDENFKVIGGTPPEEVPVEEVPEEEIPEEEIPEEENIVLPKTLEDVVKELVREYMWKPFKQTDEYKVYDIITSKIHAKLLNTTNIDDFIKRYKIATTENIQEPKSTFNTTQYAGMRSASTTTPSTSKSKGLIQDILDSFDVESNNINTSLRNSKWLPIQQLATSKEPLTAMKLAKEKSSGVPDNLLAAEIMLNFILLNNEYTNQQLADVGINVSIDDLKKIINK